MKMSKPTRYWITSGVGESEISELDAIDNAFMNSGLGYQNHIKVSSIPPVLEITPEIDSERGITHVEIAGTKKMIPFSTNIHVVKSIITGNKNQQLTACIALAKVFVQIEEKNTSCVLAFESKGKDGNQTLSRAIDGVKSMALRRKAKFDTSWGISGIKTVCSELTVRKKFGCSVSFVVFDPFTYVDIKK